MKNMMSLLVIGCLTVFLSACSPGQNIPGATAVGAAAGGIIGASIFGGSGGSRFAGAAAGALIGGSVGYAIGRHMDQQDRINMQEAIVNTPVNEEASWTNQRTHTTYVVRPVQNYHHNGRRCRRYLTRIQIDGQWHRAYGRACRMPDGSWKIIN